MNTQSISDLEAILTLFAGLIAYGGVIPMAIGWTLFDFTFGKTFADAARSGIFWGFMIWVMSWAWLIGIASRL
jgi:hypothetical protein